MNAAFVLDSLLEASARAVAVVAFTGIALAAFRVKAPAVRHAAWTAALVVMLALPVASSVLPTVPLPGWVPHVPLQVAAVAPAAAMTVASDNTQGTPSATVPMTAVDASKRSVVNAPATIGLAAFPVRARDSSWTWRQWVVLTWFTIVLVFVTREVAGAWMARRLAQSGVPVEGDAHAFASPRIVTPVVVGVLAPRVMVPPSWSKWGAGVREMVLLHERAHVSRRDPLVACLARLNRAVFWFHPVAWWLQRHMSRTAEQACDELVVRTIPDRRLYAALLVEMAKRLHHNKARVAWQGIGVVDGRRFEDRVDRVLRGAVPQLSPLKKVGLAVVSTLLISLAVACGTAAAPLTEDPELAKSIAANAASFVNYEAAIAMNLEQATALEKVVANNPDDLNATQKLLIFYLSRGQKLMGWNEMVAANRPHVLRMIERHPESSMVTWRLSRRLDPEGYEKARALWLAHVERPGVTPVVLSQAASFFERVEKPLAEQLLLRAKAADPDGPTPRVSGRIYRLSWSRRLGPLYAMAIAGSHDMTVWDEVTTPDAEQLRSPFAKQARQKLDQSSDPALLLSAGSFLINYAAQAKLDFDPTTLGRQYVTKALELDPTSAEAKRILTSAARLENHNLEYERERAKILQRFGKPLYELDDSAFDQLPDSTKLEYASALLWSPYSRAMGAYQKKNLTEVEAAFVSLKKRASTFQRLVDGTPPATLPAGFQVDLHIAFGTCAMHEGNRQEALRRLGLSVSAPSTGTPVEGLGLSSAASKLAYDLLDAGERESVAVFYDGMAGRFGTDAKTRYEQAAKAIREGRMPPDYQRYRSGRE